MSDTVTIEVPIEHRVLKGKLHVITSEWFRGLYVAAQSEEQARAEVGPVLVELIKAKSDRDREKIAARKAAMAKDPQP